ncbi:helix-turn-helix transcriptional regulator [Acetobacter aceti]|nr:helix-turn-helix transcriptional regulator [Acetobacter aceti]
MNYIFAEVNQKGKPVAEPDLSPAQCRGARAMLEWNQDRLAEAAGVSRPTIKDFERGARTPHPNNLAAIRAALEAAGVEFTNGDAPGVRLLGATAQATRQRELEKQKKIEESGILEARFSARDGASLKAPTAPAPQPKKGKGT